METNQKGSGTRCGAFQRSVLRADRHFGSSSSEFFGYQLPFTTWVCIENIKKIRNVYHRNI